MATTKKKKKITKKTAKKKLSAAGRKRIADAQKKRWAAFRKKKAAGPWKTTRAVAKIAKVAKVAKVAKRSNGAGNGADILAATEELVASGVAVKDAFQRFEVAQTQFDQARSAFSI